MFRKSHRMLLPFGQSAQPQKSLHELLGQQPIYSPKRFRILYLPNSPFRSALHLHAGGEKSTIKGNNTNILDNIDIVPVFYFCRKIDPAYAHVVSKLSWRIQALFIVKEEGRGGAEARGRNIYSLQQTPYFFRGAERDRGKADPVSQKIFWVGKGVGGGTSPFFPPSFIKKVWGLR